MSKNLSDRGLSRRRRINYFCMNFDVPFIVQESEYDCGPVNLLMALNYLEADMGLKTIKEALSYCDSDAVFTLELATAAAEMGYEVEFYSSQLYSEHDDKEFYQEHSTDSENQEMIDSAEKAGVDIFEDSLTFDEVKEFLTESSIPIVLIDWNQIKKLEGYQGHFVPLTGYNDSEAIIHNPAEEKGSFTSIDKELFNQARKADGTDEDILVIKKS